MEDKGVGWTEREENHYGGCDRGRPDLQEPSALAVPWIYALVRDTGHLC